jgi:hypothetical protein
LFTVSLRPVLTNQAVSCLGCFEGSHVMRKLLCVAAAGVFSLGLSAANAATVTLVGSAGITAVQTGPANISGVVLGSPSALAFLSDYIEFTVAPTTFTTISVDDLAGSFPNEQFQLTEGTAGGTVVLAPQSVTNVTFGKTLTIVLAAGVDYFLELLSGQPNPVGNSSQAISVVASDNAPAPTPLPGGLALLLGGLGVLGFAGFQKRRKAGNAPFAAFAA